MPTPLRLSRPANTSLVGTATPGLTSRSGRRGKDATGERISPRPSIQRGADTTQTGMSEPRPAAIPHNAASSRLSPQSKADGAAQRRRLGAAAADARKPPADSWSGSASRRRPSARFAARARAAFSTRLSPSPDRAAANGPSTDKRKFLRRLLAVSASPSFGEHRQALQGMKAVGALVADMQEQVDLGGRKDRTRERHYLVSPIFSFCSSVAFSPSSGPKVSAWSH